MAAPRSRVLREVEVLARVHTKTAIETLVSVCGLWETNPGPAVTAASAILDRGWGKPQQNVTVETQTEHMSDDDLARHIEQRLALIAHRASTVGSGPGCDAAGAAEAEGPFESSGMVH